MTYTSIPILDALLSFPGKIIEAHMSNIWKREPFRHHSFIDRRRRMASLPDSAETATSSPSRPSRGWCERTCTGFLKMTVGTLAFYSDFDDFQTWKQALQAQLPALRVVHASETERPEEIDYAMVWKPPQGIFERMTKLRLIINLGAGVDSLVGRDDLPPNIPITRITDPQMARMMAGYVLFAVIRHARDIPHSSRPSARASGPIATRVRRRTSRSRCWDWGSWAPRQRTRSSAEASGRWAGRAAWRRSTAWNVRPAWTRSMP